MIPGGYGFEVIKFDGNLRDVAKLPEDVRIVRALTEPVMRHYGNPIADDWFVGGALRPVFILVCHRYSPRVQPGAFYQFTDLDEFLSRYAALDLEERMELLPCDPHNQRDRTAWHRSADGKVREYVWHDTGGWVPRWTEHESQNARSGK